MESKRNRQDGEAPKFGAFAVLRRGDCVRVEPLDASTGGLLTGLVHEAVFTLKDVKAKDVLELFVVVKFSTVTARTKYVEFDNPAALLGLHAKEKR